MGSTVIEKTGNPPHKVDLARPKATRTAETGAATNAAAQHIGDICQFVLLRRSQRRAQRIQSLDRKSTRLNSSH